MKEKHIPAEILAFVQRCQAVAGPWALYGRPEFDVVNAVPALLRCWKSLPPLKTHIDRVTASAAILRVAWNVQRQLPRAIPAPPRERMSRAARLALVIETLAALRNQHVSLKLLAASLNVTDSHLCRVIHTEMGMTFPVLLHGLRIVDIVVWLRTSPLTVKEIAGTAGYPDTKTMDRVFRGWLQMSPSDLRALDFRPRVEDSEIS
jgi:AraC-like DNA-binding protein